MGLQILLRRDCTVVGMPAVRVVGAVPEDVVRDRVHHVEHSPRAVLHEGAAHAEKPVRDRYGRALRHLGARPAGHDAADPHVCVLEIRHGLDGREDAQAPPRGSLLPAVAVVTEEIEPPALLCDDVVEELEVWRHQPRLGGKRLAYHDRAGRVARLGRRDDRQGPARRLLDVKPELMRRVPEELHDAGLVHFGYDDLSPGRHLVGACRENRSHHHRDGQRRPQAHPSFVQSLAHLHVFQAPSALSGFLIAHYFITRWHSLAIPLFRGTGATTLLLIKF